MRIDHLYTNTYFLALRRGRRGEEINETQCGTTIGDSQDTSELVNSNFILQTFCQIESQNYCIGAQPL